MLRSALSIIVLLGLTSTSWSLEPEADALFCRVIDVGAGESCVILIPGGHAVVFDGGNYKDGGATVMNALEELLPEGATIDLLVISHSDSDHLAAIDDILDAYTVRTVLHTGDERTTDNWRAADAAIRHAAEHGTENLNLKDTALDFGREFIYGPAKVTFVAGWHKAPPEFGTLNSSEARNAISIVIRVDYKSKSILFCGDSVGRHIDDPASTCVAAEKYMVDHADDVPIRANVLVAAHHGADNGSSTRFIEAVQPQFTVFSAGHAFQHPRKATAQRFLSFGLTASQMFRTDRGDDEGTKEWSHLRIPGHSDPIGDDDVDILIRNSGQLVVEYRNPDSEEGPLRELLARLATRETPPVDTTGFTPAMRDQLESLVTLESRRGRAAFREDQRQSSDSGTALASLEERLSRQISQLQDALIRCERERQPAAPPPCPATDPVESARRMLEVVRELEGKTVGPAKPLQVEWDALITGIVSVVVTALSSSTIVYARRLRELRDGDKTLLPSNPGATEVVQAQEAISASLTDPAPATRRGRRAKPQQ